MRILVTGGAGFMGSGFIRFILGNELVEKVVNYDILTYAGNEENLVEYKTDDRLSFVRGDIRDSINFEQTITAFKIDTIVNFAAETHVDRSIEKPLVFLETNVLGTANILELVKKHDLRFHQISTDEVFGSLDEDEKPFDENTPYNPHSPYSASKASADHLVKAYFDTYKSRTTISNCTNNYGPFQFPEKFIPLAITNLIQGKKIPVYGTGKNIREWVFVDDHSSAIWSIIQNGSIGESYCIGSGMERRNIEVVEKILSLTGNDRNSLEYVEDRKGHDWRYAIDHSKIKRELGWNPQVNFDEGMERTVKWYMDNEWWWKKLVKY